MSRTVFDYLCEQDEETLNRLYGKGATEECNGEGTTSRHASWACKAVFQSLSALAKAYVVRLLFVGDQAFTSKNLLGWISADSEELNKQIFMELRKLRIFLKTDRKHFYRLNPYFRENMKVALCDPAVPWPSAPGEEPADVSAPTLQEISTYCNERWDAVLRFLVTTKHTGGIQSSTEIFFKDAEFIAKGTDEYGRKRLLITAKGYEYLLKDQQTQVW